MLTSYLMRFRVPKEAFNHPFAVKSEFLGGGWIKYLSCVDVEARVTQIIYAYYQKADSAKYGTTRCIDGIRCASFWRRDRLSDLDAIEQRDRIDLSPRVPPIVKNPVLDLPRDLGMSVTCSDRRVSPRFAWVESLCSVNPDDAYLDDPIDLVDLHPDIFASFPRIDLVHKNLYWQAHYRLVDWRCITTRAELLHRSRRKPWPQKGTGRARHGNRRTHIWSGGAQCKGPRGPESFFSILPYHVRVSGLVSMLTSKYTQGDLHIVDDLALSDELEKSATLVYVLANSRAMQRLRLQMQNLSEGGGGGSGDMSGDSAKFSACELLAERLSFPDTQLTEMLDTSGERRQEILAAVEREKIDTEDFLDLIKGGRSAEAARVAFEAANYLRRLVDSRSWGPSVLFVTEEDTLLGKSTSNLAAKIPGLGIALACASYSQYIEADLVPEAAVHSPPNLSPFAAPRAIHPGRGLTLLPLHGLNVWSMVHHDSLVLTRSCLDRLEKRLLEAQRRIDTTSSCSRRFQPPPLADDWLVDEAGYGFDIDDVGSEPRRDRHFSPGSLGDIEHLKRRLS